MLIEIIPMICREFVDVKFIIGGDGPKRILLEKMLDYFDLHNRVEILGKFIHNCRVCGSQKRKGYHV